MTSFNKIYKTSISTIWWVVSGWIAFIIYLIFNASYYATLSNVVGGIGIFFLLIFIICLIGGYINVIINCNNLVKAKPDILDNCYGSYIILVVISFIPFLMLFSSIGLMILAKQENGKKTEIAQ